MLQESQQSASLEVLLDIARDLTASLAASDRYARLIAGVRRLIPCDAACLLRLEGGELVPVAGYGLTAAALGRRYAPREHPRLDVILRSTRARAVSRRQRPARSVRRRDRSGAGPAAQGARVPWLRAHRGRRGRGRADGRRARAAPVRPTRPARAGHARRAGRRGAAHDVAHRSAGTAGRASRAGGEGAAPHRRRVERRRHPRHQRRGRQAAPGDRAGRGLRPVRAHHRRDRRRQGTGGAPCPRGLGSRRRGDDSRQLRRAAAVDCRERAVRSRDGRVHRRHPRPCRQVRGGRRRHALPR